MKGFVVRKQIGWQVFQFWQFRDYTMRSGRPIQLVEFRSICAHCGKAYFASATETNWRARLVARRCNLHRQPGKPVNDLKPPIKLSALPGWAQPDKDQIRTTSRKASRAKPARKVKATTAAKRPETTSGALSRIPRPKAAPDLSYLD